MAKVKTSISLEEEVFRKLSDMSTRGDRSISGQVSHLIKNSEEEQDYKKEEVQIGD